MKIRFLLLIGLCFGSSAFAEDFNGSISIFWLFFKDLNIENSLLDEATLKQHFRGKDLLQNLRNREIGIKLPSAFPIEIVNFNRTNEIIEKIDFNNLTHQDIEAISQLDLETLLLIKTLKEIEISRNLLSKSSQYPDKGKAIRSLFTAWYAAGYAARSAAWYAAGYAAGYAAWDAAGYAAWDAAWDAAGSAAWSAAGSAAWSAAWSAAGYAAWSAAGYAAWSATKAHLSNFTQLNKESQDIEKEAYRFTELFVMFYFIKNLQQQVEGNAFVAAYSAAYEKVEEQIPFATVWDEHLAKYLTAFLSDVLPTCDIFSQLVQKRLAYYLWLRTEIRELLSESQSMEIVEVN